MQEEEKAVILSGKDNVATTLTNLAAGTTLEVEGDGARVTVTLASAIPFGHKFSLSRIEQGSPVIKYGEVIGLATSPINPGDYVHIHNVVSTRGQARPAGGER